ncbi:MAG: PDZ domain-containing protein [Planctomycetes bacterium]|nr:PDZ domain-containing protein [Planctomycetota bacterium]
MKRSVSYGPVMVLAVTVLAVLLGGPYAMRQLAYAEQEARVSQGRQTLKTSKLAELSDAFREVAKVVEPSVVHISVSTKVSEHPVHNRLGPNIPDEFRRFFPGIPDDQDNAEPKGKDDDNQEYDKYDVPQAYGSGSGWVYGHGNENFIVTNNHVVKDADEIIVKFFDKSTRKATVVGTDPQTDIAVLKVDDGDLHPAAISIKPVEQGEMVFAFGSPFQFDFSMSQGIVSGSGRRLGILGNMGYENFIQTDAAINPGNSGGPLCNIYGEVIGMNSAIATRTGASNGIGFAIPSDMIKDVVNQIIDKGKVSRGYLGVWIRDLDDKLAKSFGYSGSGVLVEDLVGADSPAGKGGMKAGDIITKIEGVEVTNASELRRVVARYAPGQVITVDIYRDGKNQILKITLTEQPKNPEVAAANGGAGSEPAVAPEKLEPLRQLGLEKLENFTEGMAKRLDVQFTPGVVIEDVRAGSVAAAEGLRPGVVVTEVMGTPVKNLKQLTTEIAKHDLKKGVRLRVMAGDVKRFVLLALPE